MILKYFYDDTLAQASYLVGCPGAGVAMVVDPARDIQPYLDVAEQNGLKITHVTETHIHADFVSGTRELAHATGATMLLSDEGGEGWQYQFPEGDNIQLLYDGDSFMIGGVKIDVMHTPGHTPEHLTFMVTDNGADVPMALFTGDFIFVGDVGRPDLLEEAAGQQGTREIGAKQQFANIQRMKDLPDYLQILPGHGAGSACGKALGAVPSTTLGYEKLFNPAFQHDTEEAFVEWLLDGQPEAPKYFAQMKKVNKEGAALIKTLDEPQQLDNVNPDEMLVIDTRSTSAFAEQNIVGTINIPANSGGFTTYVGWYVNYDAPTAFIVDAGAERDILKDVRAIGVDNVVGYMHSNDLDNANGSITEQSPEEIHEAGMQVLDVRGLSEYEEGHIPDAMHIHMGHIPNRLEDIPRNEPLAVQCGGGLRSQVVASILQKHGFDNVINMRGGIGAWKNANLPITQD